jgi:putative Holliday junction resolvase
MRVLAIDVGRRRVGLAISDPSGTLARPLIAVAVTDTNAAEVVAHEVARLSAEDDGVARIVVGVPVSLDGRPNAQTAHVLRFIGELKHRTGIPIDTEGERLTSREAESRLAVREKDWRKRKAQIDAAAAAIILQDYLDRR